MYTHFPDFTQIPVHYVNIFHETCLWFFKKIVSHIFSDIHHTVNCAFPFVSLCISPFPMYIHICLCFFLFDDNSSILGISSVSVDSSPIIVAARCCYVVKIMVAKLLYKTDGRGWDIRHGFPKIFWLPMRSPESPEIRSSCPAANCGSWSTRWWCRCWIGADSQQGQPEMWSSDGYGIQMGELCG